MKKILVLVCAILFLSFVSAKIPKLESQLSDSENVNIYTGNTNISNSSNFWDNLDSPSDILGSLIVNDLGWVNASGSDTNETTRFNALVDTDCSGTDKMVGVYVNGTPLCSAVNSTETDPYWTANQSLYVSLTELFGFSYYNSTDFDISDYALDSKVDSIGNFTAWDKDYGDLINTPTALSDFTNDVNYWNDTYATFNKTYADTLYIASSEEANLNVNSSDFWDDTDDYNTTHFEVNGGSLTIVHTWFTGLFDTLFGAKDTDDLTEGASNLYDNQTWDEARAISLFSLITEPLWTANYSAYNSSWSLTYNSTYANWNKTYADTLYLSSAYNPFDQVLNTTSSVEFESVNTTGRSYLGRYNAINSSLINDWGDDNRVLQFGENLSFMSFDDNVIGMAQGMYWNGTNWVYTQSDDPVSVFDLNAGYLVLHTQEEGTSGDVVDTSTWSNFWFTPEGDVGWGALPTNYAGYMNFLLSDTTGAILDFGVGGTPVGRQYATSGGMVLGTLTSTPLSFIVNNGVEAKIDTSGNFNITSNNITQVNCISFDNGGEICSA